MSGSHEIAIEEDRQRSMSDIKDLSREIKAYLSSSSLASSSSTGQSQNCKIRKIQPHDRPRENTMNAYTPKIISIGLLHHGKDELKSMEDLKKTYVNKLLTWRHKFEGRNLGQQWIDELLDKFIKKAKDMEEEVRGCYDLSDIKTISSDDFVRMLVIDGCFLLEFLLHGWRSDDLGRQGPLINQDIQLFENQLPFLVLQKFYEILKNGVDMRLSIEEVAYDYMRKKHLTFGVVFPSHPPMDPFNLLHLHYMKPKPVYRHSSSWKSPIKQIFISCYYCSFCFYSTLVTRWIMSVSSSFLYFIYKIFFAHITYPTTLFSATEIEEAGVRLQGSHMDLRFEHGTLLIPFLTLNKQSLRLLKNLMVFEFYFRSDHVTPYVHTYVSFLSDLIKNPEDLKVMEKHDIIRTSGGGDESFALVNELIQAGFEELMSGEMPTTDHADLNWQSRFSIIESLKIYCKEPRHRWWAMLMKDYFGNPWSILGVLAGVILLVLATLQTVFTVLSYYHH